MPRKRPTSVLVLAVLNLVFGCLGLLGVVCAGVQTAAGGTKAFGLPTDPRQEQLRRDLENAVEKRMPIAKVLTYAGLALDVVVCFLLIGGGIGLMQMRPWGRTVSLIYAVLSLLTKLWGLVNVFVFSLPAIQDVAAPLKAKGGQDAMMGTALEIGAYLTVAVLVVTMAYPVIVLVILLRPAVVAAFRADGLGDTRDEPYDYDDRCERPADPDDRFREGDRSER